MSGCRFEANKQNWRIFNSPVLLRDCQWTPAEKGDEYGCSDYARKKGWQPRLTSKKHVVFEVKNADGHPVDQALVSLTDSERSNPITAFTDKDGTTGPRGIMLTECVMQSAGSNQVATQQFVYSASIKAAGYQTAILKNICPTQSGMTLSVTLTPAK